MRPPQRTRPRAASSVLKAAVLPALVVVLALAPLSSLQIPAVFSDPLNGAGTLQLLALCFIFGGLALTYDLLFGFTGLLSFGHALYFAVGVYVPDIAMTQWHWDLLPALGLTAAAALALPCLLGAISLRVGGIPFAMVTLAFAQAGSILVLQNPGGLSGGEEGLSLDASKLPDALVGVVNTGNLYWLALAYLVAAYAAGWWAVGSPPGRVWQAIRENERRVEIIGLRPYTYKLLSFVLASFLAALGGVAYLLVTGGATPDVISANTTLVLLVMVVLGGVGTLWGAVLGGIVYEYLDNRLLSFSGSSSIQGMPDLLRVPLSEPSFILGALFVLLVLFFPGGFAGLSRHAAGRRYARGIFNLRPRRARAVPAGADSTAADMDEDAG